jgi:protein TonB
VLAHGNRGPNTTALEIISRPAPRYPADAIRQRHQGTVMLLLTIGPDGRPRQVTVDQSSGYAELDQAAIESARQWRFRAVKSGGGTATHARIPVHFHLDPLAS